MVVPAMAAIGLCLQKNYKFSLGLLKWLHPWVTSSVGCPYISIQPVRCKGTQRFKLPPAAKEKEKWQPRKKIVEEVVMTPKELKDFLERIPKDDVWMQKYYPPAKYSFEQAIAMHRELAVPEMQDNVDGFLYLDADLDLSTKKKTKFLGVIKGTILLPHNFEGSVQSRVIAITKADEDKEKASQLGALFVGGLEVVRMIEKGEIKQDDFDHVVLNMDMLVEAALIKKALKDRFPAKKKGNLGTDTEAMVQLFINGRSFESIKVSDSLGKLTFAFGKLNMDLEQLRANFKAAVDAICAQKSPSVGGPIFSKVRITCPPSSENFLVEDETVLPAGTIVQSSIITKEEPPAAAEEDDDDDGDAEESKATN